MRQNSSSSGPRPAPRRTCVGCRAVREQACLVRITADGKGGVLMSSKGSAGRGAYCCPAASCLEEALRRKALPRALRCDLPQLDVEILRRSFAAAAGRMSACSTGLH